MNKLIGIVLILFPISITLGEKSGLFRWDIHTDIDPINSNVIYQTSLGNTSTTSEDLDPKEIVSKMLEKLRELLKNGDKEHDLPSIDPYWFSMKREIEEENLQLNMSFDGQVSNTSNLFWNNLFTCPLTMQIQMELEVKDVFINGTYNLTGMAYEVLPVFGDGDFQINIEAIRLMLTAEVSPKQGDNPLEMDNINIHFLDLRGLEMNFENLMGDTEVALLLSHLAADFSEKMAYNVVSDMEETPNEVLYSIISDRIKQITLLEIVSSFNAI